MSRIGFEFFSGGGGVAAGWKDLDDPIYTQAAVEFDPKDRELSNAIADTYDANFSDYGAKTYRMTVQTYAALDFPGCPRNAFAGHASPVCTNFSQATTKQGETADDITSARAIAKGLKVLKPKHFTLENVAAYEGSTSFRIIKEGLDNAGYKYYWGNFDFSHYGLPQKRKRLFLVSSLDEVMPQPTKQLPVGAEDAIADLIPSMESIKLAKHQEKALLLERSVNPAKSFFIQRSGVRDKTKIRPGYEPIWTITKHQFHDTKNNSRNKTVDLWINGETPTIRTLSLEAFAVLCGFPRWYRFHLKMAIAGSILGYAVPPLFITKLYGGA